MKQRLSNITEFFIDWIAAPLHIKLYSTAMLLAFAWMICISFSGDIHLLTPLSLALCGATLTLAALALLIEIHGWASTLKSWQEKSWLVSGVLAGLLAMALAFSAAYAATLVNEITGVPPSLFPYTTAFLTPPAALAVVLIVILGIYIATSLHLLLSALVTIPLNLIQALLPGNRAKAPRWSNTVRGMRLVGVGALIMAIFYIGPWYALSLNAAGRLFASSFEMYAHDPCISDPTQERMARIDDENVLVVSSGSRFNAVFERRRCSKSQEIVARESLRPLP